MAIKVKKKLFLKPTENRWESHAVLNPTVIKERGIEHLIYRGVAPNKVSSLGYLKIKDGKIIERNSKPLIHPTEKYDKKGVEDPRIVKIGNIYHLLYTGFDGKNAGIVYAVSKNLRDWKKKGIISPRVSIKQARKLVKIKKYRDKWKTQEISRSKSYLWDKDAVLFPEKINGKFVMIHRFLPDVQIVKFKNFSDLQDDSFWRDYIENLGEYEDRILSIVKGKWGLKNKSDAVNFIIDKFEEEFLEPELRLEYLKKLEKIKKEGTFKTYKSIEELRKDIENA